MFKVNVEFYSDMGHFMYSPMHMHIPNELINKIYNEYVEEYFVKYNNLSTCHHRLKKNIKNVEIVINNINYNCNLNF